MKYTIDDILKPLNISDGGCESKIARINDILASFAIEAYELYPLKRIEKFNVQNCTTPITTEYPIAKVWGFYGKWCNVWCSLDPKDCCAWYRRLLMEEMYWDNLDKNSYAIVWDNEVECRLPAWTSEWFIVYSRGFPELTDKDSEIEMDRYMMTALRLLIKSEYALDWDNDLNMSANYKSRFDNKIKALKRMYDNNIKFVILWNLNSNPE